MTTYMSGNPVVRSPLAQKIADLSAKAGGANLVLGILEAAEAGPAAGASRVGGSGFALGGRHPHKDGKPMTHIVTLTAADVPALAGRLRDAAAVAVYVAQPDFNEAYTPYSADSAVVMLTAADLMAGPGPKTEGELEELGIVVSTVEVAEATFAALDEDEDGGDDGDGGDDDDDDGDAAAGDAGEGGTSRGALKELRRAIYNLPGRAGGEPLWLQYEEDGGSFLFQFDEALVPMNLGDSGIMYVFDDTAYWQCH